MKKITSMKRVLSVVLSLLMICSLSVPAFAQGIWDTTEMVNHKSMLASNGIDAKNMSTKTLADLSGNTFTLVETGEKGFYIYDPVSNKYLELSTEAPSPYLGYEDNLYYFGPLCYYVKNGDQFVHTITKETMSEDGGRIARKEFSSALTNVRSASVQSDTASIRGSFLASKNKYIPNGGYIRFAKYPPNECNTCGYIAACLVLFYWHKTNGGIIAPEYLDNGWLRTTGTTLQDKLLTYGSSNSSWGKTIRDVLISYCSDRGIAATSYYYVGKLGVTSSINAGRPAIIFGWLTSNPSPASVASADAVQGNVFHAVTAYGQNGRYFICHYGWSGYEHVLLDEGLVGSCTLFQLD